MDESATSDTNWLRVCSIEELARGTVRTVSPADLNVAVFRLADDRMFAIEDRCPHRGARLSAGIVYETDKIACLDHGWGVSLVDGRVEAPNDGCVATFPVKVENGWVFVRIAKS